MERSAQTVRPVWGLQYMLSRLAEKYPFLPKLTPDGVFGERTLEAVMRVQWAYSVAYPLGWDTVT